MEFFSTSDPVLGMGKFRYNVFFFLDNVKVPQTTELNTSILQTSIFSFKPSENLANGL